MLDLIIKEIDEENGKQECLREIKNCEITDDQ